MTIFIEQVVPFVRLRFRAVAGGAILESSVEVRIGKDFAGYSFEELSLLGLGEHQLEEREEK